jgi:hypothetical protein
MNPTVARSLAAVVLFCGFAFPKTYSTDFDGPENPLSEDGAWNHNGLDWRAVRKVDGIACGTQTGWGGYDDSYAHLSGFRPDQTAWGVIQRTSGSRGIHEVEIHLRWSDSAHSAQGYECLLSYDGSYAQIVRWNGPFGDFTYIGWAAAAPVPRSGDTLKASIKGDLISVTYNGSEIMRARDATFASGDPGIGFFIQSEGDNRDMGFTGFAATDEAGTGVREETDGPPAASVLFRAYPNPFNPVTTLRYELPARCRVQLALFDLLGREVARIVEGEKEAGIHEARFDGSRLRSGVFLCRLRAGETVRAVKIDLVR